MEFVTTLYQKVATDTTRSYQVFQISRFISIVIGGILLVQLGFDEVEVSSFEWFMFLIHAFSFFWSMGLKNGLLAYGADLSDAQLGATVKGLFLSFTLVASILSVSALALGYVTPKFMIFFVLFVPATIADQWMILRQDSAKILHYGIWLHTLYIIAIIVGALIYRSIDGVILLLCFWVLVKYLYSLFVMKPIFIQKIDWNILTKFWQTSWPLLLYITLGSGMDVLDGFLVEHFFDDGVFAKFRYGAKELPVTALIIGALVTTSIPLATSNLGNTLIAVRQRLDAAMNWMFPLTALLILVSPFLFQFFYSEEYLLSAQIFNVYLLIIVSRVVTPQIVLYALKENKVLMWVSLIELVSNLVFSLILLKYFGIMGIAYATIIAYTLEKILLVSYLHFSKSITPSTYLSTRRYIIYSILLISVYIISLL